MTLPHPSTTSAPVLISLDPDCENRFRTLANNVAVTHIALGRIVDESLAESKPGQQETILELYADVYYQCTGERVAPRTVRHWRDTAVKFSRHDLEQFELLPESVRIESIKLSDDLASLDTPMTAQQICQVAIDEQIATIPALRERILPHSTDSDGQSEPGWVMVLNRLVVRWEQNDPRRAEFNELIKRLRALVERRIE